MVTLPDVIDQAGLELARASRSFLRFFAHTVILSPPPAGDGATLMEEWEHLLDCIAHLESDRLITIIKARQIGLSWLMAAYALWTAIYTNAAVVFLFSQDERRAKIFLEKCRYINAHLPEHLRGEIGVDNALELTFPAMNSKIVAWASTEGAGRSDTATLVIQDEADHHPELAANYASVKPTLDAGGQLIHVSTVLKKKPNTLFKEIFRDASNSFVKLFYGWSVRPGRDDEWYEQTKKDVPTTADMSPELYMEQEYPVSAREALRPSRVLAAFDPDAIAGMYEETKDPKERRGILNIFQLFVVGHTYVAATDPSKGTGGDDAVTVVLDLATGAVVADIRDNHTSCEQLAFDSVELLHGYDDPLWAIEDNDWGKLVIKTAQDLEYPNLYEHKPDVAGWHTAEHNRYMLWGELMGAVRNRQVVVYNKLGLGQFEDVIRNPDKDGRIEAMEGTHDDYPLAVGLAWQMRKHAYTDDGVRTVYSVDPAEISKAA
jgi:hypothetical protein